MRRVIRVDAGNLAPDRRRVLLRIGMDEADYVAPRLETLIARAAERFVDIAAPVVVFETIDPDAFAAVYDGVGVNAPESPLQEVFPRASRLALFVATLGPEIDEEIDEEFRRGDPALGYLLDATASDAADRFADLAAERFLAFAIGRFPARPLKALPYSPGYCGWHVSGQRALFDRLRPVEIGVRLTPSCLMDPLKSVSGVLVAGRPSCHHFRPAYTFCEACTTHACRARMARVK
jgi:cobalamin-dependent methionine synthase-like protein